MPSTSSQIVLADAGGLIQGRWFPCTWLTVGLPQLGGRSGVRGPRIEERSLGKTCLGKGEREQIPTGAQDQPGSLGGWKTAPGIVPAGRLGWERSRGAQPFPTKQGVLLGELPSELVLGPRHHVGRAEGDPVGQPSLGAGTGVVRDGAEGAAFCC